MGLRSDGSASKMALLLCCALICLFSFRALLTSPHSDAGSLSSASHVQVAAGSVGGRTAGAAGRAGVVPPLCTAKCGGCTPCSPVHVAVPPGRPVIAEYYPEAWRCKCHNKLYMP